MFDDHIVYEVAELLTVHGARLEWPAVDDDSRCPPAGRRRAGRRSGGPGPAVLARPPRLGPRQRHEPPVVTWSWPPVRHGASVRRVSPQGSRLRRCSRAGCGVVAVATLTYVYADSTAVVGPLATYAEPHCYDLCEVHAGRLTAPRGWELVRLDPPTSTPRPLGDDLEALANAVREAA